jgi:Scramblase
VSPLPSGAAPVQASRPEQVQRQVTEKAGIAPGEAGQGGGTVFSEPVLVVNQKMKLIELTNEYSVYDQQGTQIASVTEVGQSVLKKVVRFIGEYDQFFTHRLEVRDLAGQPQLLVTRPAKFLKSKVIVERPGQGEVGRLVQQNAIGKIRFGLMVGDRQVGELRAENWRAWDFAIVDESGTEVARIKKTFEGIAKTMFTSADNYVVRIHRPLQDPLLSLVVASALTVDTALKQDSRGLN